MPRRLALPRLRALVAVALPLAFASGASAAPVPPDAVGMQTSGAPRVNRGSQSEVTFVLQVAPGYAILSSQLEEPGLQAASITFRAVNNIAIGAARFPKARQFKVGEKRHPAYIGDLVVRIPLTVSPNTLPGLREIQGKLVYQVCSATECFDPVRKDLAFQLDIAP